MFPSVSPKQSFPDLESDVLAFWKANSIFQKSIDSRPLENPYRFYDGPPFITGTPHYGSLLSSVVKDVVGRYWTMRGKRVERVWGWDCHGLPIEEKVQKKLGLASNKEIEERGVKEFIDGCYEYTKSTSAEWNWYIDKIGRWVDMDRAYRTMDQDYMESVMWVFKQLWNKGLIYEGKRVSLYSWKLGTPISNFEVAMDDTYQEVHDPAITVKFRPLAQNSTGLIIKNQSGKVLFLKKKKNNKWTLVGGKCDEGESHLACVKRETEEEIGLTLEDLSMYSWMGSVVHGKYWNECMFETDVTLEAVPVLEDTFSEYAFFSAEDFPELEAVEPYDRFMLEYLKGNMTQYPEPWNVNILAWTTTPWTIPANMALAVGKDIDYVLVEYSPHSKSEKIPPTPFVKGGSMDHSKQESLHSGILGTAPVGNENHKPNFNTGEEAMFHSMQESFQSPSLGTDPLSQRFHNSPLIKGEPAEREGDLVPRTSDKNPQSAKADSSFTKEPTEQFIVAKNRVEAVFKGKGEYTILREFKGSELVGIEYIPPFPEYYYESPLCKEGGSRSETGDFVSEMTLDKGDSGDLVSDNTGIEIPPTPFVKGESMDQRMQESSQSRILGTAPVGNENHKPNFTTGESPAHITQEGPHSGILDITPQGQESHKSFFSKGKSTDQSTQENPQLSVSTEIPLTPFVKGESKSNTNHRIYHADFATDSDGTGIVHIAPEFGESDFALAKKEGIFISEAMDEAGKYTKEIFDYEGLHYQEANTVNIERMKANDTLFKHESITHRVPFCPRSNTPLVQKAQSSWFIDIQSQKEKLLKANEQIHWFPEYLKFGRFAKGIESAPDWCISRTRYWGAPMPVWMNEKGEKLVVGSREEIFELNKPYGQLTKLIITRHAESEANVQEKYDDIGSSPLSHQGKEQSETLLHEWEHTKIDIIITSPFTRAISTAEPLAQRFGLDIIHDERLKETDHGKLANAFTHTEAVKEARRGLFGDDHRYRFGETGESYDDIEKRMKSFVEDICERYPGKTVFVVSHGFPVRILSEYLTGKTAPDKTKNASARTFILDVAHKNLLNLHKPYIDSILLTNEVTKPKKVLGIHGFRRTENVVDFFKQTAKNLQKQGIEMYCPLFEEGETVNYENWKRIFLENIDGVDTVFTHSFGCRFSLDMIIKYKISLKRLVLIAPPEGKHERLQEFFGHLQEDISDIKKYVEEVIILYSLDDKEGRVEASKRIIEQTDGCAIQVNGYGHFNLHECKIIEGLIEYGTPFTRIPEVLDVWMDSGSMPYAQVHYPFENKEKMESSFPADFIAEYVGQIRAWFYVMHVLGVLLDIRNDSSVKDLSRRNDETEDVGRAPQVPTPAFLNVITTGVINGNDGRKMSKSYGNYPDPRETIEKYGADPIRFYMLNSPLLSGGDMDFKEEGIVETIKSVMLPLWNTYSFFTTYSNIDEWEPSKTEVFYMRHGETQRNVEKRMSGGEDNSPLTEKGREQARIAGKEAKEHGISFDIIISSPLVRARETAEIVSQELGYEGEIVFYDTLKEQMAGKFADMKHDAIMAQYKLESVSDLRRLYKEENGVEDMSTFEKRVQDTFQDVFSTYAGKKILIVAHAGVFRPIHRFLHSLSKEDAYFGAGIPNANIVHLSSTKIVNPLDRWIMSRLHVLIAEVHTSMEAYDVSRSCRALVEFMDVLTNWYVRLSRRRFWGSDMSEDKNSAYTTLYTILLESSKLLAPFMPFLAESIYKGLTDKKQPTKVIIIRHGRTDYNEKKLSDSIADRSRLNEKGLEQANNIVEKLRNITVDYIFSSPFTRSKQTIEPLARERNIPIRIDPRIGEMQWNLQDEFLSNLPSNIQERVNGEKSESFEEVYIRMKGFVDEIVQQYPGKTIVVSTHGDPAWEMIEYIQEKPASIPLYGDERYPKNGIPIILEKRVSNDNSVHLQYATLAEKYRIADDLNRDMETCERIVSLGLALRSRKGIRVRQPLTSITITRSLDPYYEAIIRDELNVKEIRLENPEKIARKICKPDARKIGPKYGKDVQNIIREAKEGNFVEGENGNIIIGYFGGNPLSGGDVERSDTEGVRGTHDNPPLRGIAEENSTTGLTEGNSLMGITEKSFSQKGFTLEPGEYTLEYIPLAGVGDVEGGFGMVIAMDMEITEDLQLEGYARDIIRTIQEMRKEAAYAVNDRISLHIYGEGHAKILAKFGSMIASETLSTITPIMHAPDRQKEILLDDTLSLTIQIEK